MSKIAKVKARQVFDSRGNPTIEAEVFTKNKSAIAICPSGASTGTYEAFEKRDKNNKRYLGKSVLNAISLVNSKVSKKLKGQNIHNQERIDALMINLDGTRQKTKLGANSILAVSMAVKKLSAKIRKKPLYKRDKNNKRYLGKSVFNAISLINSKVSKKLKGQNIHNQERIDALMINLDGTRQKTKLGANSILAVSMALSLIHI